MLALLLSAVSVLVLPAVVRRVPAGHVQSLHRRGRPPRMLEPGLHLVLPGFDRLGHRIDLTGQVLQFEDALADAGAACAARSTGRCSNRSGSTR